MMAADVGWSILNWVSHYEWALRQLEEAFQQGDHEEALGLPITPLCDRNTSTPLAHIMFNFLSHTAAVSSGSQTLVQLCTSFFAAYF